MRRFLPVKKGTIDPVRRLKANRFRRSFLCLLFILAFALSISYGKILARRSGSVLLERPVPLNTDDSVTLTSRKAELLHVSGDSEQDTHSLKSEDGETQDGFPNDGQPHYDIDPLSFGKPELFDAESEVFFCDRRHWRTDVCTLKGDVRVDARRNLVTLYAKNAKTPRGVEVIKPYTRKWEFSFLNVNDIVLKSTNPPDDFRTWVPATAHELEVQKEKDGIVEEVDSGPPKKLKYKKWDGKTVTLGNSSNWSEEVYKIERTRPLPGHITHLKFFQDVREKVGKRLVSGGGVVDVVDGHAWVIYNGTKYLKKDEGERTTPRLECDIRHSVPGVLFSTGGYTGNVFHEFTDGLIPFYLTTQHFEGEFVPIVEDVKLWWFLKYENVLRQMSKYPAVLMGQEKYIHCFPHVIVGLRFHDDLTVYPQLLPRGTGTIQKFQKMVDAGWAQWPFFKPLPEGKKYGCQPVLTIMSRASTRVVLNEDKLVALAKEMGFIVRVLSTEKDVPLALIWQSLHSSNVMMGIHGAAMTHFFFMRPGTSYVQYVPLGMDWFAKTYIGDPAVRLGLQYIEYKVNIKESSLSKIYPENDTVLVDPQAVHNAGWLKAKEIYFENQNVTLDLERMRGVLQKIKVQLKSDPLYLEHAEKRASEDCKN